MCMEKVKSTINSWGSIEVDEQGKVFRASPDFYEYFDVMKNDLLGKSITNIIQTSPGNFLKSRVTKNVFS